MPTPRPYTCDANCKNQVVTALNQTSKVDNCGTKWPCNRGPGQENGTHCTYDHPPPTTFAELASKGPPNCTHVKIDGRPAGENHKGSLDFWRREKPAFRLVADKYKNANMQLSK